MFLIPATVIARLGPWLMRAGPAASAKAVEAVSKAGVPGIRSVGDIVKYVKLNPMNSAVLFSSLASAGFAVSDLFSPADKQDDESRQAATSLAVLELKAMNVRLDGIAAGSEELSGISGDRSDLVLLRRILKFARGHYGSAERAIEAFRSHQAFFELNLDDIKSGFENLDLDN